MVSDWEIDTNAVIAVHKNAHVCTNAANGSSALVVRHSVQYSCGLP